MFKRKIFIELFAAMLTLPAFAAGFGPNVSGTVENACDYSHLGVESGPTTLRAIWLSNISLDSKVYSGGSDIGIPATTNAAPGNIYSRYGNTNTIYSYSSLSSQITQLTTVPSKAGYVFGGFYRSKSGGDQVISSAGNILPAAAVAANNGSATWYARWTVETCAAGEFMKADEGCTTCPAGYTSEAGATKCYKTVTVACADVDDNYVDNVNHRVATYEAPATVSCKQYAGAENESVCDEMLGACHQTGWQCMDGYEVIDGNCVLSKVPCKPGEYLPQGVETCVECLANSYCLGGTFDKKPTTNMGIIACESGLKSPAGSQRATDCGHVLNINGARIYLHAADDEEHTTHPSFVTEIDGKKWYGDMTKITSTCKKTMAPDTTTTWHVQYNNSDYTVHGRYVKCE